MNILQKFITIILIIGLISSLNLNLFLIKPLTAKAGVPTVEVFSVPTTLKELILDTIGHTITQTILRLLEQKIRDWGAGRKSDANEPFAVSDWVRYFKEAAERGVAKYIVDFEQTKIEPEIKQVLENLGLTTLPGDLAQYHQYAESTLEQDLGTERYQQFKDSGYSLSAGGWDAWFSMMKPQNNLFGQIMMAQAERARREAEETKAADKEVIGGSIGYRNETITTKTDIEACKENCPAVGVMGEPDPNCIAECESKPGIALETQIKNWGSDISTLMTKSLGADIDRLVSADEISELIGVIFSALISKTIDGLGSAFSFRNATVTDRSRAEYKQKYSYQRSFKQEQTLEDIKDVRATLLTNILKSIQQLSRSIIACDEEEMMTYTDWSKNIADMLAAQVEALYIGMEGINITPDFEVLDPRFAPYSVYGYSWGHVPANKFPSKCRSITDQLGLSVNTTCRSIKSGLEPNYNAQCETCMYDHDALNCPPPPYPPQPYPSTGQEPWSETIISQKQDFYNNCNGPYQNILNTCETCLKRVDEKCDQIDPIQKEQCILNRCDDMALSSRIQNYTVNPPSDGLEFYNQCLIEEKKDACYVCLKEYYMPATYCEQIADYTVRAIDKYPALVKREIGGWGDDKGEWWGPYDRYEGARGGECDDNYDSKSMSVALLCRIMPDFQHLGEYVCKTRCFRADMTEEELKDITDFRPNERDCGNAKIDIGGRDAWNAPADGTMKIRGKCCANFWQHDKEKYAICVGSGEATTETPPIPETCPQPEGTNIQQYAECLCSEGSRPIIWIDNWDVERIVDGVARSFYSDNNADGITDGRTSTGVANPCAIACATATFQVPNMADRDSAWIFTNTQTGGNRVFIAEEGCTDTNASGCSTLNTSCDYVSTRGPVSTVCAIDTPRAPNSQAHCRPWSSDGAAGKRTRACDLSGYSPGQTLTIGIWNSQNTPGDDTNGVTGVHLCVPCNPNDSGYPYYGVTRNEGGVAIPVDQCNNKRI